MAQPSTLPAESLFKGFIRAYYVGTHTADVQLAASPRETIDGVRVGTHIHAADCVVDRECTVLFFGAANCQDAVVIAVQSAVPGSPAHYIDVEIILPVTGTLAVGDSKSPHIPIRGAINTIDTIYLRSLTAVTASFQVEAFNQAGASQWTETISPSAEVYKLLSGLSRSLADTNYVRVDITAYTSGGSNVLLVIHGRRAVTPA
jgi:hypothetical protein